MSNQQLGSQGENLESQFLQRQGLKILKRNFRTKFGEIDILAQDGRDLVVVEVKAKTNRRFGAAVEMVTKKKQGKLLLLAREMQVKYKRESVRVDVVSVDQAQGLPEISYYKGVIADE